MIRSCWSRLPGTRALPDDSYGALRVLQRADSLVTHRRIAGQSVFYDKSSHPVPRKRLSDLGSFYFKGLEIVPSAGNMMTADPTD